MKVVINVSHGAFKLSDDAHLALGDVQLPEAEDGLTYWNNHWGDRRGDRRLIKVVEKMGNLASGNASDLIVVDLPMGGHHIITKLDGAETVYWSTAPIYKVDIKE